MLPTPLLDFVPFAACWAVRAARDAERVRRALGPACGAVHHVGSTSVPGMAAVPIVDLVVQVEAKVLHGARLRLMARGFRPAPQAGRAVFYAIDLLTRQPQVELTCFEPADPELERLVALFAHLRANGDAARRYEAEKLERRARHGHDLPAYLDAKRDWMQRQAPAPRSQAA